MRRAYYSSSIHEFLKESDENIVGELTKNHSNRSLVETQVRSWFEQIKILKDQLSEFDGRIYFEFAIPRMGKRVDNILIIHNTAYVIEFKVGNDGYAKHAIDQVLDYTIDLKNFHEGSHKIQLVPVLVDTDAPPVLKKQNIELVLSNKNAAKSNRNNLREIINDFLDEEKEPINIEMWANSIYKPTPTIVEAAQALYKGHNVKEITRSDSGAKNLSLTADSINEIIDNSKKNKVKSICFVTGVPGAGKTLAGLNAAVERMNIAEDEHAVFLSGNGPLVDVLREALARDDVKAAASENKKMSKEEARTKSSTFIQNIHHFRDEYLISDKAPVEKVVVFDEAQRAWTMKQVSSFMKRKKGIDDFNKSEPQFLIEVMNRHDDWCTIVCLIGGGQEIYTGEAGLVEWINSLRSHFREWEIHFSNSLLASTNYLKTEEVKKWLFANGKCANELHLAVSIRSFRSEHLSNFIHKLLSVEIESSNKLYDKIKETYPIVLTRDFEKAKQWLRDMARGNERIGLLISSGAKRIRACGIDSESSLRSNSGSNKISGWFLNDKSDVRSSYYLETAATEFVVQGLEIDWACVAWGGNFYFDGEDWNYQNFKGSKWQNIHNDIDKEYLKNSYRVLLTRARQGMVIFLPEASSTDHTRPHLYYDETYKYLKEIGLKEIN